MGSLNKIIPIAFLVIFLCACPVREKIGIENIVPTRMGAGIKLSKLATVESISVRDGKRLVFEQKVDEKVGAFLVDFNWEKGETYTFNIKSANAVFSEKNQPF